MHIHIHIHKHKTHTHTHVDTHTHTYTHTHTQTDRQTETADFGIVILCKQGMHSLPGRKALKYIKFMTRQSIVLGNIYST